MRILKHLIWGMLLALSLNTTANAAGLQAPRLIAVYFYADWCPNCKQLSPVLAEARAAGDLDNKDILFVKLDLTNKATIHQSILLAQQLGIGTFVKEQGSATGYVALLDAKTKKELARVDRTAEAKTILSEFEKPLKP